MKPERLEILQSPEYHTQAIQLDLYKAVNDYMIREGINRTELAQRLGVSKGYVTQLLSGDYDHKLSKLVELAIAVGKAPYLGLLPFDEYDGKVNNHPLSMLNLEKLANSEHEKQISFSSTAPQGSGWVTASQAKSSVLS